MPCRGVPRKSIRGIDGPSSGRGRGCPFERRRPYSDRGRLPAL